MFFEILVAFELNVAVYSPDYDIRMCEGYVKGIVESNTSIKFGGFYSVDLKNLKATTPVLFIIGSKSFLSGSEVALREFILKGGVVIGVDVSNKINSEFSSSFKKFFEEITGSKFNTCTVNSAIMRSFFLLNNQEYGSFYIEQPYELYYRNEPAVILIPADIFTPLLKDETGNYIISPVPGGERQRINTIKMLVNTFVFSLTGTYKLDAVHKGFIEKKLW